MFTKDDIVITVAQWPGAEFSYKQIGKLAQPGQLALPSTITISASIQNRYLRYSRLGGYPTY